MKSLMLAVSMLFSLSALAGQEKISMSLSIKENVSVYNNSSFEGTTYEQIKSIKETITRIEGTGPLSQINKVDRKIDTDVVGIDINGYSKITLAQRNGKTYAIVDGLIDDAVDGMSINIPIKYNAELEFTKGDFESYKRGEEVVLVMTDRGQQVSVDVVKAKMQKAMNSIKKQLSASFPEIGDIKVDTLESYGKSVITGTLDRLTVIGAEMKIKLSMAIKM